MDHRELTRIAAANLFIHILSEATTAEPRPAQKLQLQFYQEYADNDLGKVEAKYSCSFKGETIPAKKLSYICYINWLISLILVAMSLMNDL